MTKESQMSDIVERLRLRGQGKDTFSQHYGLGMQSLCNEAATEIELLRAALAAQSAAPCHGCDGHECDDGCQYPDAAPPPSTPQVMDRIEAEARRYAEMYPPYSDSRNTFVIFADWIAALAKPGDS